ncbi:ABC transporter ATP-binding protein [Bradyrhizobium sp. BR 1432]|uniref:ABC transporter ATP-binding protein n=1 Tax=Bradyrhizobium sp. BR 1432 TaxID=3447966 RepID=UPI003EE70BFC
MSSLMDANGERLTLDGVSVSFPIYSGGSRSLKKGLLYRGSRGRIASDANDRLVVEALRNVSLQFSIGDRVALIGANGAGKTTLLRVMAGIYEPVSGVVRVSGRISPMFDIGLGIDPELSGLENIRLRGLLLGLSPDEIERLVPDIGAFTELGDYLDLPARTYSSGMLTRLTFAVATCFAPEILLMDEWILAGDAGFLAKAERRIESFVENASVLVLASHNEQICRTWCTKAVWLDSGEVKAVGRIDEILSAYRDELSAP